MSSKKQGYDWFEPIFAQMVVQSLEDELASIPPRKELEKMYQFSERHQKKMAQLFGTDQEIVIDEPPTPDVPGSDIGL